MIYYPVVAQNIPAFSSDLKGKTLEDIKDWHRAAKKVADHINSVMAPLEDEKRPFSAWHVAAVINENKDLVGSIFSTLDGESSGLECLKGEYEKAVRKMTPPTAS